MEHNARFSLDEETGHLTVEMRLRTWKPLRERLKTAIMYVINPGNSRFGHYDEAILRVEDYDTLRGMLDKSETRLKR